MVFVWHGKVVLANSKRQGNVRDQYEDEKMMRLFIVVPTSFNQKDIENEFSVSLYVMMTMMLEHINRNETSFTLMSRSLPETNIRRIFNNSSSGSYHSSDKTWQDICRVYI